MNLRFPTFIALRYLRSKRKEVFISIITVLSVLGVAISVMVLNIVLAIMTGFEAELQTKLLESNPHILVRRYGGEIDNWGALLPIIKNVPGVTAAFPYTYNQALLSLPSSSSSQAVGIMARGVADLPQVRQKIAKMLCNPNDIETLFSPARIEVLRPDGSYDEVKRPAVIIGKALMDKLGLLPGSVLSFLSPQLNSSPQGLIPKVRRFVVSGIYSSGLIEYESSIVYMSLKDAQDFFGLENVATGIEVEVLDGFQSREIAQQIENLLRKNEKSPYYVSDWSSLNAPLWEALKLEKRVYFIVLLLLILLASFSIVTTLVMIVMEKTKDIAIMKTMGATNQAVRTIFLIQGTFIGVLGSLLGTFLGYVGCIGLRLYEWPLDEKVFSLSRLPVHIIPMNFTVVALASLVITAVAGIYPAIRGALLKPADALRFE